MKRIALYSMVVVAFCVEFAPVESAVSATDKTRLALEKYFQAWNETDTDKRTALVAACWAEKGTYTDPSADLAGRKELVDHIDGFVNGAQTKSFSIVQVSAIDFHHNSFRFAWEMQDASGKTLTPGIDYGEFNDKGEITKIVGFFGPMPELK